MTDQSAVNPLLKPWNTPFGIPPFDTIKPEHFRPAFDTAMADHKSAIEAIADSPEEPTFDNTIVAMERAGLDLGRVALTFFHLTNANTNEALQAAERTMAPLLARHSDEIYLNEALFRRIEMLWQRRDSLGLSAEQRRLLERTHMTFTRAGAALDAAGKQRLAAINERLAEVGTQFSQNVLADENAFTLVLEDDDDLAGLPKALRAVAAEAAEERGLGGKWVITLSRSSIEPFLQSSTRRDLRDKAFEAWIKRGENGGEHDNRALIAETVRLRTEQAKLLGYESFAHYRLADTMAKTPEAVAELLTSVWEPARRRAETEQAALQELVTAEGGNFKLAASDWRHYSERLRQRLYDFDEVELEPYLQLDKIIEAAFYTAQRLFGLSFAPIENAPLPVADARAWQVKGTDGRMVGVFIGDYFARSSKRSGAWASSLRPQHRLDGEVHPIILNVMNFAKAPGGKPTLISFEDARTLFHEFGHALHGLLSNVTYPSLSGTRVTADFVELPSQLYEHWLEEPDVLRRFAVHAETGEPMPSALLEKVLKARKFNQGFAAVEYTASALVDLDLHLQDVSDDIDVVAFEKAALERIGMPEAITMRHRTPHFQHVFAGGHYAAGYYSYLWSEVLDADAFAAFDETGDIFHDETARRLHDFIYSGGNIRDPAEAYRAFRGRDPDPSAVLRKKGLAGEEAA